MSGLSTATDSSSSILPRAAMKEAGSASPIHVVYNRVYSSIRRLARFIHIFMIQRRIEL